MKNYYEFKNLIDDKESINYYSSFDTKQLITYLNSEFDNIEYYLIYYAEFLKEAFNGDDYDEHYYIMNSLLEGLNDIKIIINILKDKDIHE